MSNKTDWLKRRNSGIGGSDAAAILGLNPWLSNQDVYRIKVGELIPEEINNEFVEYGTKAEEYIRELFKLDFPQYEVEHDDFNILHNADYPFIIGTLDGILTDKNTGENGVLEIKTTRIQSSNDWSKWKNQVPQNYYIQVLHYMLVTGYSFAILVAQIKSGNDDDLKKEIRHYKFDISNVADDIQYLLNAEIEFWQGYVEQRILPPLILPGI